MRGILDSDSKLFTLLTKLTLLLELNLLVILGCLPIVTVGASLCSMHAVLLKIYRDEENRIITDYLSALKSNLKNGTVLWLLFLGYLAILGGTGVFIWKTGSDSAVYVIFALLALACIGCVYFTWACILQSRYVYTVPQCLRNALLAWLKYPGSTFVYLVATLIPFCFLFSNRALSFLILVALIGITLPAMISTTLYSRVFDEMEGVQRQPVPGK